MFDGDISHAEKAIVQIQEMCKGRRTNTPNSGVCFAVPSEKRFPMIPKGAITTAVAVPPDGYCFFSALAVGMLCIQGSAPVPAYAARAEMGQKCREWFLTSVEPMFHQNKVIHGLPVKSILLDSQRWQSPTKYLAGMGAPITGRRQWGGFSEAIVIASLWHVQIAIFAEDQHGFFPIIEPLGDESRQQICLLWKRTHYELLILSQQVWQKALGDK